MGISCPRRRLESAAATELDVDLALFVLSDDDRCGFFGERFEG
jgi:hypothetical protein